MSTTGDGSTRQLAFVLWNGNVGGAEVFSVALAQELRRLGNEITIVFIGDPQPLAARLLDDDDVPYRSLGFGRGHDVLRHHRRYAAEVARVGPDGALLVACGFMGAALRAGGYRGPVIAVEHGDVLEAGSYPKRRRALRAIGRLSGAWADDIEVAVSDFVLARLRRQPHARTVYRIYNGIDPDRYGVEELRTRVGDLRTNNTRDSSECIAGYAGRLVYGKGADCLIEAIGRLSPTLSMRLLVAGDGPERARLESLTRSLGIGDLVEFLGLTHDMPAFWQACDVAVVPSAEFTESCPMTTLEAMASGRPVVATRNGGLPELVIDRETGIVVPPRDGLALADALSLYARDAQLRSTHGTAGRARVIEHFNIKKCAQKYLDLFGTLSPGRPVHITAPVPTTHP